MVKFTDDDSHPWYHVVCLGCRDEEFIPSNSPLYRVEEVRSRVCDSDCRQVRHGLVKDREPRFKCERCRSSFISEEIAGREFCETCASEIQEYISQ